MSSLIQLAPPLPVDTPLGEAIAVILETDDFDVYWCTFLVETGECWWWQNHQIRLKESITAGRVSNSPIRVPPELEEALAPHRERYAKKR